MAPGLNALPHFQVTVLSRHTTTAVTVNEAEPRLMDDIRQASGLMLHDPQSPAPAQHPTVRGHPGPWLMDDIRRANE